MSEDFNKTMSGTQPSSCLSNPTGEKVAKTLVYCLILLVSLAGNTVIGIIVYRTRTMRNPINFFIVNMAMSDLLFPIFLFPLEIRMLYMDSGLITQSLCKMVIFLPVVSFAVSIQSLVLIAMDRFGAVVFPLRSPLITSKLCPFFILATWIIGMAFFSPYLFVLKVVEYNGRRICRLQWNESFGESSSRDNYEATIMVVLCFIPFVMIATFYVMIYIKLKLQKIPGEHSVNAGQQRQQRERNVLKMTIAIVLGCAACWLPYSMGSFAFFFASGIESCGFQYFFTVAFFMNRANCAINPCICLILSRNYREGLKTIFK